MATHEEIRTRIDEMRSRTGKQSITVVETFDLMEDILDKSGELGGGAQLPAATAAGMVLVSKSSKPGDVEFKNIEQSSGEDLYYNDIFDI